MKPPRFEYFDPTTVEAALDLLGEHGENAKVLAGGQSLMPLLNFRLIRPQVLVDLNGIGALAYVRPCDGGLALGALTRQRALERSAVVRERCPLVAQAVPFIGHAAIRNRGTIGGTLAHADPAAELPAVVTALGGTLVLRSIRGERVLPADRFFVSYLTTAAAPDEILVEVRLPGAGSRTGSAFQEVSRRHGDFALVGVAAIVSLGADDVCTAASVAVAGVGPVPLRVDDATRLLLGEKPDERTLAEVGRRVSEQLTPDADLHASSEYRKQVAGVLARRALGEALGKARGGGA
ncbi:MAG: xanthine dehydrogenase family protein subunit M [Candidatus Rokubacteria bacterium]|nr:xanthine dehydrogenase family protein subunit M [Candidatus Rokubacteria bacterium]